MKERVLSASECKAKCLACLGDIEKHGESITITKRGRPVAVLGPAKAKALQSPRNQWSNPVIRVLPLTYDIALDVASMGTLRDPSDRVIFATARVHRLRLVTSDQRIINSGLVPVLE